MKRPVLLLLFLAIGVSFNTPAAGDAQSAIDGWLRAQQGLHSWSAEFTQTRKLKSLVKPLVATGEVWFKAPNQFRWEVREPAPTTVVRGKDDLLIIYPRLKRVERLPMGGKAGMWKDALALLEAGFPRSQNELESQYEVSAERLEGGRWGLNMTPKSAAARKMIPRIRVELDSQSYQLQATEMVFADGSLMRNDFRNTKLNPAVEPSLFTPEIPADFKVEEPMSKR